MLPRFLCAPPRAAFTPLAPGQAVAGDGGRWVARTAVGDTRSDPLKKDLKSFARSSSSSKVITYTSRRLLRKSSNDFVFLDRWASRQQSGTHAPKMTRYRTGEIYL